MEIILVPPYVRE